MSYPRDVALGGRGGVGLEYRALSLAGEARGEATPDAVKLTALDSAYWNGTLALGAEARFR